MSGQHAKIFQPSKAKVWMHCAGAIAYEKQANLPEEAQNKHGASGTFTHSIAERNLNGVDVPLGTVETHDTFTFKHDAERQERVDFYTDAVRERGGIQFYEVKLDLSPIIGIPDQFGTSDAVILIPEEGVLESHDLKDGRGAVLADDNEQLIAYLLMAWREYELMADFKVFRGWIHQPKLGAHLQAEYTREQMEMHALRFRSAAQHAHDLLTASPATVELSLTPGAHCEGGWCKMRGVCPARRQMVTQEIPNLSMRIAALDDGMLGELLSRRAQIEAFFKDLHAEAFARAQAGKEISGWKLSNGRQGNRKWKLADEEAISELLYEDLTVNAYERNLISPTTAEKLLKKNHSETWVKVQKYIERSDASITLVQMADARPAISLDRPEFSAYDECSDLI